MEFAARERAVDPPVEQPGQDYFSLHAGRYIWMRHEMCGFSAQGCSEPGGLTVLKRINSSDSIEKCIVIQAK